MKTVQWQVFNGEILDADYRFQQEEDQDGLNEDELVAMGIIAQPQKQVEPDHIITYTGQVLYIGQEDDISGRRFIKFVVKDTDGLVWSLLPQQIRYI